MATNKELRRKQKQGGRQVTLGAIDPGIGLSGIRANDPGIGVSAGRAVDPGIGLSLKKPGSSSRTQGVPAAVQTAIGTNVSKPVVLKGSNQIRTLASEENPYSGGSSAGRSTGTGSGYGMDAGRPSYMPKYQDYIDGLLGGISGYGEYQSPYADRIEEALGHIEGYGPYQSQYADQIAEQLAAIQNRGPFSYDLESDPAWQAYKQQYTREGRRASEDAMGQYAAMTGGMPSTAAMAAAQQANSYYNAQMNDKIPELYKLAYDMYLNEGNQMANQLSMLQGLDQTEYGRWGDTYNRMLQDLSMLRGMDESQYGRWQDAYNRMLTNMDAYRTMENDNYGRYRDTVGDWERDRAFDYAAEQDALEWDYRNRAYADERADAEWEKAYRERAYGDSRADTAWEQAYKQTAYDDSRADTEWDRAYKLGEIGPKLYAYGDGEPYEIGSAKGQQFVSDAAPGQTMVGGDGSIWAKNADGSTTITRGGQTWTVAAPAVSTGGRGGGGGRGNGGGDSNDDLIRYRDDLGKGLYSASEGNPELTAQYLADNWENMAYSERAMMLRNLGYDYVTANTLASNMKGLSGNQFESWLTGTAHPGITPEPGPDAGNSMLTESEWEKASKAKNDTTGASNFASYEDYVEAYIEWLNS